MAYVLASVYLATTRGTEWAVTWGLSTAAWLLANFLQHGLLTVIYGDYSPGVVTAGAVYVPVALYVYQSFGQAGLLTPSRLLWSLMIGFVVMYVPQANAVRQARADRRRVSLGQ